MKIMLIDHFLKKEKDPERGKEEEEECKQSKFVFY